jgi:hypothetical protein
LGLSHAMTGPVHHVVADETANDKAGGPRQRLSRPEELAALCGPTPE